MGIRRQEIKETVASRLVAAAYAALRALEDSWDESWPLEEALVDWSSVSGRNVRVWAPWLPPGWRVERQGFTVTADESLREPVGAASAYRATILTPLRLDSGLIRSLALETTGSGTEFILLYLETGEVAVLEGERYRVRIPMVDSAVVIHTHPEGACDFSEKDLESALDLFIEGGVGESAATPSCAAIAYRVGLLLEDDLVKAKRYGLASIPGLRSVSYEKIAY